MHKAAGVRIKLSKNNDHDGYHISASNVARKATAFPLWSAIDKRRNRNTLQHRLSCVLRDCSNASIIIISIIFWPTSTKPQAEILKLNEVNDFYYYYYYYY